METAEKRYKKYRNLDPFPGIPPSLLNSADIHDYIKATGMIDPYDQNKMKSASYPLSLEGEYFFVDENDESQSGFIEKNERFTLQKNSIAFVSLAETIRLPNYIAARFNLKISHVYKGLLLGTGPLVDPGYQGPLQIPLHNLTSNEYKLIGGEQLIWMEFTKISPNDKWHKNEENLEDRNGEYVAFPDEKKDKGLDYLLHKADPHRNVNSTISSIRNEVLRTNEEVKNVSSNIQEEISNLEARYKKQRNFQWGTIAVVVLSAVLLFWDLASEFLTAQKSHAQQSEQSYQKIQKAYEDIVSIKNQMHSSDINNINSRMDSLESLIMKIQSEK